MTQITSGVRVILSKPFIYNSFQSLLGANQVCDKFVKDDLRLEPGQVVLDIGCGTAAILNHIPTDIEYYGIDISEAYIASAKQTFRHRKATFHLGLFDDETLRLFPKVDVAFTSGLLHHLTDQEAEELFGLVAKVLKKTGRFISADPCFIKEQNIVSKFLIKRDRGQNIRTPQQLEELAKPYFANVDVYHRNDFLRIPYDHAVLSCRASD